MFPQQPGREECLEMYRLDPKKYSEWNPRAKPFDYLEVTDAQKEIAAGLFREIPVTEQESREERWAKAGSEKNAEKASQEKDKKDAAPRKASRDAGMSLYL